MTKYKSKYPFDQFRPGVEDMLDALEAHQDKRFFIIRGRTGCHAPGTKVIMFDGTIKAVEDVIVGDLLMGPDSSPRKVLELFSGQDEMYNVSPHRGGDSFIVNKNHILSLMALDDKNSTSENIIDVSVEDYLSQPLGWQLKHELFRVPVNFSPKEAVWFDSYLGGIAIADFDENERIPKEYKTASRVERLQFLAGLLDRGGSLVQNEAHHLYKTRHLSTCKDIAFLARSLGLSVSVLELNQGPQLTYELFIWGKISEIPCRRDGKLASKEDDIQGSNLSGFALKSIGLGQFYGFMLDGDHRYLLEDFTVTHNSGKSGVAIAISRALGCHILTATKLLQDQYATTPQFNAEFVLKGKSNYTCNITGKSATDAPCSGKTLFQIGKQKYGLTPTNPVELRTDCVTKNGCEYYVKKQSLNIAGGGILNYDLAFISGFSGDAVVLDEAHNFIDKILDVYAIDISRKKLAQLVGVTDAPNQTTLIEWLKIIQAKAMVKFEMAGASGGSSRDQIKSLADKAMTIISEKPVPGDFYVNVDEEKIQIKPLFPSKIAHKFFNRFKKVFFLSATIDRDFASLLGLPPLQTLEYNLDSTFPIKHRPIYFPKDIPNINFSTKISKDLPQIRLLDSILKAHPDRGIIHTANYRIFSALQAIYKKNKRFTWVEQGMNKADALKAHMAQKNSILVSPSMTEGVDLKDDLARWQVIFKVPFPAKTEYVEALESAMPGLYEATTRNNLVQAYGRPVRSEKDWAHTYVLDGSLKFQLQKIDTYFAQAVKMGEFEKLIKAIDEGRIGAPIQTGEDDVAI